AAAALARVERLTRLPGHRLQVGCDIGGQPGGVAAAHRVGLVDGSQHGARGQICASQVGVALVGHRQRHLRALAQRLRKGQPGRHHQRRVGLAGLDVLGSQRFGHLGLVGVGP
ncbi:MAG: hypothetical protein ACK56I_18555, partial [bacterium]